MFYKSTFYKSTFYKFTFYKSMFYKFMFYKSTFYKSMFYKSMFYKSLFYKSSPCFTNPIQSSPLHVGWGTLQFDRKGYIASWLHYSYFWPDYSKPLGGAPYSLIENVIAQAGCITPISGRVIPNRWVGHLTV